MENRRLIYSLRLALGMAIFDKWSKQVVGLLRAGAKVSSTISTHGDIIGDAREVLVRDILARLLPSNMVVGTGQIVDSDERISKQIDIVIYRGDFPVLRSFGSADVFLLEGVVAAIEVKSTLDKKNFLEALENCRSVRKLFAQVEKNSINALSKEKWGVEWKDLNELKKKYLHELVLPPTYVFGYRGYKSNLKAFSNVLRKWSDEGNSTTYFPEVICTEGLVGVKNLGRPFPAIKAPDEKYFVYVATHDEAPLRFLIAHLLHQVIHNSGQPMHGATKVVYEITDYMQITAPGTWSGVLGEMLPKEGEK